MAADNNWSHIQERGAYWGILALLMCYRLFGRRVFRVVLAPVMTYFFLTGRAARTASLAFLERACGEPANLGQSFRHFMSFGDAILDKIAAWSGEFKDVDVVYEGRDILERWSEQKQGAVLLTSHLGNVEALRALSSQRTNFHVNVLVHTRHAQNFNRVLRKIDPNVTVRLVEVGSFGPDIAIKLKQLVDQGEFIVVAADRVAIGGGRKIDLPFLGFPARFPSGGALIAAILKCPIGMLTAVRDGPDYFLKTVFLGDFSQVKRHQRQIEIERVMRSYGANLEDMAKAYPLQWFNFFDFWAQ